jgi:DNA invertase Pin-like site-specific DNA recombinase
MKRMPKRPRRISAVYARTAASDPGALAWQVGKCTAYCRSRGWTRVLAYADDGASGMKLGDRWQLARLLDDARAGLIERVVVEDMERFARSLSHLNWLVAKFRAYRVAIHIVGKSEFTTIH